MKSKKILALITIIPLTLSISGCSMKDIVQIIGSNTEEPNVESSANSNEALSTIESSKLSEETSVNKPTSEQTSQLISESSTKLESSNIEVSSTNSEAESSSLETSSSKIEESSTNSEVETSSLETSSTNSEISMTSSEEISSSSQEIPPVPEVIDVNKEVTIRMVTSYSMHINELLRSYVDDFNKTYPNIHVEIEQGGSIDSSYTNVINNPNNQPDIFFNYAYNISTLIGLGRVCDLTSLSNHEEIGFLGDDSLILADLLKEGSSYTSSGLYSIPFLRSTDVMVYDTMILEENGLEVPTHWFSVSATDTTSIEYVATQLKKAYPTITPIAFDNDSDLLISLLSLNDKVQSNKPYCTLEKEEAVNALNKVNQLINDGLLTTKGISYSYCSNLLNSQEAFIGITSSAGLHYFSSPNVDVTYCPSFNDENSKIISNGPAMSVLKNGDRQKEIASYLFIKYLATNAELQAEVSVESGYLPVNKDAYKTDTFKNYISSDSLQAKCFALFDNKFDYLTTISPFTNIRDLILSLKGLISSMYDKDITAEEAYLKIIEACGE